MSGTASKRDHYEILGVSRSAGGDEIKRAYRKLVRQYHPDANPGNKDAEERFKEVSEAYEVLSDPQKKAQYDQFGFVGDGQGDPFGGFGGAGGSPFGDVFGDIFDTFFGGGRSRNPNAPRRGADLEMELSCDLEDVCFGVSREVTVPRWEQCKRCGGSGAEPGSSPVTCPACGGTGQVEHVQRTPFGQFAQVVPCTRCGGRGKIIEKPCKSCRGEGRLRERHRLEVKIPPGADTGTRLRIQGEGEMGANGGPPGDLLLLIRVKKHKHFVREGDALHYRKAIAFPQAALGSAVTVPTLEGEASLEIPPGTQPGKILLLPGKGMPRLRNPEKRGDLHIHVDVEVPRNLSERQRALLEQLAAEMDVPVKEGSGGLLEKFKEIFLG